jgi:cell fate regulator YaaT (PSP1 superfamily)
VRIATAQDTQTVESFRAVERQTLIVCKRKIAEHGLDMKLIDADFSFDGTKITFHFTSDGRVDFRELVRDLGATFHKRIELRQIGIRDGARLLGGIGPCGRQFCCSTFLNEFQAISVKMAKNQSLSLNPVKISGACGNLMCCLKHEEEAYEDLQKDAPQVDSVVDTPIGKGLVTDVNLLRRVAKVRVETSAETTLKSYPFAQLGYTVSGEYKAPTEQPEIVEKAPAFESPKYEPKTQAMIESYASNPPQHERVREHNVSAANQPRRNQNQSRNGNRGAQPSASQPRRDNNAPRGDSNNNRRNNNNLKWKKPTSGS